MHSKPFKSQGCIKDGWCAYETITTCQYSFPSTRTCCLQKVEKWIGDKYEIRKESEDRCKNGSNKRDSECNSGQKDYRQTALTFLTSFEQYSINKGYLLALMVPWGTFKQILHFFLEIGSFYHSPRVKQLGFTILNPFSQFSDI